MMLRLGRFMSRPSVGTLSGAAALLGLEPDGVAFDFRDLSAVVRDTTTPANNFSGNVNSWLTYASPSTKWILGSNGLYSSGTTIRTEYNASGVALGARIEPSATNLFLNSRSPSTQAVTTSATSYTISGIGAVGATLTLTGTATGTLTGTGAVDRDKLTVTCTAGSLTVTVAGTWDFVQVESGTVASSPIVTAGSTVTRALDHISASSSTFPTSATDGTLVGSIGANIGATANESIATLATNKYFLGRLGANARAYLYTTLYEFGNLQVAWNSSGRAAFGWATNNSALYANGTSVVDNAGTPFNPAIGADSLRIGSDGGSWANCHIKQIMYLPRRMTNAELNTVSL